MTHPPRRELADSGNEGLAKRRVERTVQRQAHGPDAGGAEGGQRLGLVVLGDRIRLLTRREVDGQHDLIRREGPYQVVDLARRAQERRDHRHLRKTAVIHGLVDDRVDVADHVHAVRPRRPDTRRAGAHHRGQVSAREADDAVGDDAERLEESRQRHAARVSRHQRLRVGARGEDVGVVPVVGRRRKDERRGREVGVSRQRLFQLVEGMAADVVLDHEIAHHVGIEPHHARIDKRETTAPLAYETVAEIVGPALVADAPQLVGLKARKRRGQTGAQVGNVTDDERDRAGPARQRARIGDVGQRHVRNAVEKRDHPPHLLDERSFAGRGNDYQLGHQLLLARKTSA